MRRKNDSILIERNPKSGIIRISMMAKTRKLPEYRRVFIEGREVFGIMPDGSKSLIASIDDGCELTARDKYYLTFKRKTSGTNDN